MTSRPGNRRVLSLLAGALMVVGFGGIGPLTPDAAGAAPAAETEQATAAAPSPADVRPEVQPWIHVWANQVNARPCPWPYTSNSGCPPITRINSGWYPYACTARTGDQVTDGPYTNHYWSGIDIDLDGDGYYETPAWVSDVYVSGGGNNEPAVASPIWCENT